MHVKPMPAHTQQNVGLVFKMIFSIVSCCEVVFSVMIQALT